MYINVAVNIPSGQGIFTYAVPRDMADAVAVGKRVLVPLGRRRVTGYIAGETARPDREDLKEIIDILDLEPLFDERDLALYRWMSDYYMEPLGKSLKAILPGGIDIENHLVIVPACPTPAAEANALSEVRKAIIAEARAHPGGISLASLKKKIPKRHIHKDIAALSMENLIRVEDRLKQPGVKVKKEKVVLCGSAPSDARGPLTAKQASIVGLVREHGELSLAELRASLGEVGDSVRRLAARGILAVAEKEVYRTPGKRFGIGTSCRSVTLTEEQEHALGAISRGIASRRFGTFLLHGVTGSGKTEIYLKAIEAALAHGGSALMLVPEIALTPQLLSRVTERFDEGLIAVIHSGIGRGARYDEWRRALKGDARIIIGARSAVFAPVKQLRLLIVDEEHDQSYKQEEHLVYNARDLAVVRGEQCGATVILGSATPGIQTYYHTTTGHYAYLPLTKRVEDRPLPPIELIDMKDERTARGNLPVMSGRLQRAVKEVLEEGRQALLFLNRRGFDTFLYCSDCGHAVKCRNCSVSLTHHREDGTLRCHYCDYTAKATPQCPHCGGNRVRCYGTGTEKLAEEIRTLFPKARVARMDSDSTARKGAHERILSALHRREIDILIGTQMITKGHDYPNVTLVGVVSADTSLNIPDFRAAERTFQLLTQVSGRGGRGDWPGKVLIQTVNPAHYAVVRAKDHDYRGFYEDEIAFRKELGYPPFSRMVGFRLSGTSKPAVERAAGELGAIARECCRQDRIASRIAVMGPAEAPLAKIKGRWRWHMLLRGSELKPLHGAARAIMSRMKRSGVELRVDVDPVSFM